MTEGISATIHVFLVVLAAVLFFIAAVAWPAPVEPYRTKLIAGGLFCWCISTFLH